MKRKRHGPEEIIRKLREAEALEAAGRTAAQVCQKLAIGAAAWRHRRDPSPRPVAAPAATRPSDRWPRFFGGMWPTARPGPFTSRARNCNCIWSQSRNKTA